MTNEMNFQDDAENAPKSEDSLTNLRNAYSEYRHNSEQIAALEQQLKELKEVNHRIEHNQIPNLMNELRMTRFDFDDGVQVTKSDWLSASIPSQSQIEKEKDPDKEAEMIERRENAFEWLRNNQGASIIKNQLVIDLGKDSEEDAQTLMEFTRKLGYLYERGENVHSATLAKFIKEKRKEGVNVPEDPFKLSYGEKSAFKKAKK